MPDKPKIDFNKLEEYSNDSWYVLTPENTEFGPFAWKDLLGFAGQQRLTLQHKLKHPNTTKGKWVAVSVFSELLARIPAPSTETKPLPEPPAPDRIDLSKLQQRSQRSASDQSIVLDVMLGLVDFQFKHYVTPSIIRFTWLVFLVLVFVSLCWTVFVVVASAQAQLFLDIDAEKVPVAQKIPVPIQQFQPQVFGVEYIVLICLACISSFLALLWVRVLMECVIVIFDISNNIKSIADQKTTLQ